MGVGHHPSYPSDSAPASSNGNLLQGQESLISYGRCQAEDHGASATVVMNFFFFFFSNLPKYM